MNALAGKLTSTTLRTNGMGAEGGVGGFMGGLVATSLAGGVMSELQGGKFEDGAKIGAQGYLYNEASKTIPALLAAGVSAINTVLNIEGAYQVGYEKGVEHAANEEIRRQRIGNEFDTNGEVTPGRIGSRYNSYPSYLGSVLIESTSEAPPFGAIPGVIGYLDGYREYPNMADEARSAIMDRLR
ncbi:MAG: hypothetical protein R3E94_03905 [Burkholderiaceae bacterium]